MSEKQPLRQLTHEQMNRTFAGQKNIICYARLSHQTHNFREEALPVVEYEGAIGLTLQWAASYPSHERGARKRTLEQNEQPDVISIVDVTVVLGWEAERKWVMYTASDIQVDGTMIYEDKDEGNLLMELFSADGEGAALESFEARRARRYEHLLGTVQEMWVGTGVKTLEFVGLEGTNSILIPQVSLVGLRCTRVPLYCDVLASVLQSLSELYQQFVQEGEEPLLPLHKIALVEGREPLELTVVVHDSFAQQFRDAISTIPDIRVIA